MAEAIVAMKQIPIMLMRSKQIAETRAYKKSGLKSQIAGDAAPNAKLERNKVSTARISMSAILSA